MCGDYAKSTQSRKWTFTKEQLLAHRKDPQAYTRIRLYLGEQMSAFAARLSMRQRVLATGQVYLSRMLTRTDIGDINPYLLMTTCLYVASRAEEHPVHIRSICNEARQHWPLYMPAEPWHIAECEFYLLAEIETCLVIHHAYLPLAKLGSQVRLAQAELQACWAMVNDSLSSDIPLLYAPHVIAFTVAYMVLVLKPGLIPMRTGEQIKKRLDNFARFLGSRKTLDLRALISCMQEFLSLYALKEKYKYMEVAEEVKKLL